MKVKWKIVFGLLFLVLIAGFLFYEFSKPLKTELLTISSESIARIIREEGKVVAEFSYPIYAPFPAEVKELAVSEGEEVKRGQFLAALDSTELDFQIETLEAQLLVIEGEKDNLYQQPELPASFISAQSMQVDIAADNLKRAREALANIREMSDVGDDTEDIFDNIPEIDGIDGNINYEELLEDAERTVELAESNLNVQKELLSLLKKGLSPPAGASKVISGQRQAVQSQIDLLKHQREKSRLYAPSNGVVANLNAKEGEMSSAAMPISPSLSMMGGMNLPGLSGGFGGEQSLMTIFRPGSFLVEIFFPASNIALIEEDMKVSLSSKVAGDDKSFTGRVTKIAPTAVERVSALGLTEQRIKVTVRPESFSDAKIISGATVDVEFSVDRQSNVIAVPRTALFPYNGTDSGLWLVRDGKALIQPVKTGAEYNLDVVIEKGLEQGDQVILNPQLEGLREGKSVINN